MIRGLRFQQMLMRKFRINGKRILGAKGSGIVIPIRSGVGMEHFIDPGEMWMSALLGRLTANSHPDDLFVDVGANLGQTLIRLKLVRPELNYIGFEPNPLCADYLHQLVKANEWSNVRICALGLGSRSELGVLALYDGSSTDSSASLIPDFRAAVPTSQVTVQITSWNELDSIPDGRIAVLKIDVEGAEWEVIQGIEEAVRRDFPVILIEILPVYSQQEHPQRLMRQLEMEQWSREHGYHWYRIRHDEQDRLEEILEVGIHSRLDWCDYVMMPSGNR